MKNYDIVIVGGGIAGIYTMYNLKKRYPKLKVLLLEKEDRFGGRVYTYTKKLDNIEYKMDLGAGRIGFHHKLMVSLINELKLDKFIIPITNTENYIEYNKKNKQSNDLSKSKQDSQKLLNKFLSSSKVENLSKTILKKYYLNEILLKFFKKSIYQMIESSFEYKNKLFYLNAYNAINYFKYDYNNLSKFFILSSGYSSIIDTMIKKIIKNKNYKLKLNCCVDNIIYNNTNSKYNILYKCNNEKITVSCNHLICALPRCDLIKFNILNNFKQDLNTINEISKVRIFEIYNKSKQENGEEMWFKNIPKISTNQELQFVIPINPDNGLIMSSYNENLATQKNYWYELSKKSEKLLKTKLREHLSLVFNKQVPESKYIKLHYWKSGVACWKKNVDSNFISQKILNLMPNFYICGENYSQNQAWCEGALMTSNEVLSKLDCQLKIKKLTTTKKLKGGYRQKKPQFLYNPDDPKKSFDVYIDKDPSDTISIKYTTVNDIKKTIKKLESLYQTKKYPHKRIWQVGMIMKVRMEAMLKHKKTLYKKAKNVKQRYNLTKKYFKFLGNRSKGKTFKERKKMIFYI